MKQGTATTPHVLDTQDRLRIVGGVVYLCEHSLIHKNYRVGELSAVILPALQLGQFRYYDTPQGEPVAFLCWAFASAETINKLRSGLVLDAAADWTGGKTLMFPEFIAPFGHLRQIVADLCNNVFAPGTVGHSFRPHYDSVGKLTAVRKKTWHFDRRSTSEQQNQRNCFNGQDRQIH